MLLTRASPLNQLTEQFGLHVTEHCMFSITDPSVFVYVVSGGMKMMFSGPSALYISHIHKMELPKT